MRLTLSSSNLFVSSRRVPGLASVFVTAGVIDRGYTGEVSLILFSIGINPYIMNEGDRIGQLLIERIAHVKIIE